MRRFSLSPSRYLPCLTVVLGTALVASQAKAVTYDVRAQTRDKIKAVIYDAATATYIKAKAYQGSFGAPSLNDKGAVAYACVLSGKGIDGTSNGSVIVRLAGTKAKARIGLQAGFIVDSSFLPGIKGQVPIYGSMYRFSRDVAINNKNSVAFAGQLTYLWATPDFKNFTVSDVAVYGELTPYTKKATSFSNYGLFPYLSYFDEILRKTMSINNVGSAAYNANITITSTKAVPGIGYVNLTEDTVVATTESQVIGLPYFTEYQTFSDAIVAGNNVVFIVADITDDGDDFDGIWQGNNPDLQPVVVKNTPAPPPAGFTSGGKFTSFDGKVGPSRNGKVCAFIANVSGGRFGRGVFRSDVDGSDLVAVTGTGQTAPGVGSDPRSITTFKDFQLAASNDKGQVAILGTVSGDSTTGDLSGIWVTDTKGANLELVILEGQTMTINGKQKTITKIAFNPVSGINAKGQVAFTASFTDRTSAVAVATP